MRVINPQCPNILSKQNHTFDGLHNTLDGVFRKLRSEGVGAVQKHAEPFTKENSLWKSGVLGTHTHIEMTRLYQPCNKVVTNMC